MDVQLPDGRILRDVPEGTTQAQLAAKLKANGLDVPPAEPGMLSKIGSSVSRVGANIAKEGLLGLPGLMGDLALKGSDLLTRAVVPDSWREGLPKVGMPSEALDVLSRIPGPSGPIMPPVAPPEGFGEKLATAVGAGAIGGGVLGAATAPQRISQALAARAGAISGAGAGAGGETAAQVFPDQPLARLGGSLLGSMAPGGATTAAKMLFAPSKLITPLRIQGEAGAITDPEWAVAKQNLASSQEAGVRGMVPQALPNRTPLMDLQERLTGTPGSLMGRRLQDQQQKAVEAGQGLVKGVAPPTTPAEASLGASAAANAAIRQAKNLRAEVTKPDYAFKIQAVPEASVARFEGQLNRYIGSVDELAPTTPAGAFIKENVLDKLKNSDGTYVTRTGSLDATLRGASDKLDAPKIQGESGISDHTAGVIRGALDNFGAYLDKFRVGAKQGNLLHSEITKGIVQPQQRGLSGETLGGGEFNPAVPPDAGRITDILLDPVKLQTSEIVKGARTWKASDPQAFPQLVRATIEKKLQAISPDDPNGLTKFAKGVWGEEGTPLRSNFRTMISEAAGPQARAGAENVMKAIEMAGKGRGGLGRSAEDPNIASIVGQAAGAAAIGLPRHALSVASKLLPGMTQSNRDIVELLSAGTPKSIDMLKEMSRRSPREIAAAITMGAGPQIMLQTGKESEVRAPEVTVEGTKEP